MTGDQEAALILGEERWCNRVTGSSQELYSGYDAPDRPHWARSFRTVYTYCENPVRIEMGYGRHWVFTCWRCGPVEFHETRPL